MVALGIVAILLLALTFDFLADRWPPLRLAPRRRPGLQPAGAPGLHAAGRCPPWLPGTVPSDYYVDPCHVWMHSEARRLVRLGSDGFANAFLGRPDAIQIVAHAGRILRGQPLAVLSRQGHRLTLRSPLGGTLVDRHDGLDVERATADPFGHGWLVSLRPDGDLPVGIAHPAEHARAWLSSEWERVRAFVADGLLSPGAVGATLADGGSLQPGFLMHLHLKDGQQSALERACFDVAVGATPSRTADATSSEEAAPAQGSRS